MSTISASRYLACFSAPEGIGEERAMTAAAFILNAPSRRNHEEELKEAYERGAAGGRKQAEQEIEIALERERQEGARLRAEDRQAWVANEAERIGASLASAFAALEEKVSASAAKALEAFLTGHICQSAISELRAALREALKDRQAVRLVVSAPADLAEQLSLAKNCPELAGAAIVEGDGEVRISIDEAVLETRLAPWLGMLRGIGG